MTGVVAFAVAFSGTTPPVTPDGGQAREWARRELSDPAYAAAQPTPFDRAARAVADFVTGLFSGRPSDALGPWLAVAAALVVAILLVAALLVWGRPRAVRRGHAAPLELFGRSETRSAAQLRAAAAAYAERQEWDRAIVTRFRALARGLHERGIVETPPGATVHAFARAAGRAYPAVADDVDAAAAAFDDVRYLRRAGDAARYACVADVDDAIARAVPAGAPEPVA